MKFMPAVELPQIAIVGAMFAVSIASWRAVPSQIAVHFEISGKPDRYGGKSKDYWSFRLSPRLYKSEAISCRDVIAADPRIAVSYLLFRFPYLITLGAAYAVIYLSMRGIKVSLGMILIPALAFDEFAFINFLACDFGIARVERVIVAPPLLTRKSKSGTIGPAPQLSKQ
jgi:Protein of unknown function (DUF1648)